MQLVRPQWLQFPPNRLTQLLLLAVTVLSYSVLSIAIGNSLFVSYVGAAHLPLAFILIGLCSIPAYVLFSQVVDRYSGPQLFRVVLLGSIAAAIGLRLLLIPDTTVAYYVLLIAVFFQWDFHNNVLYPSLLTDYFTTLEYKRYAPYIGVAQAVGTLIGGGVTTILSHYFRTRELLWCLPILFALGVCQLLYLENSQRRLNRTSTESEAGLLESLRGFPELIGRYPLAVFLASSSFLLVIIYISSEFLWFNIYGAHFSDQALTGFLGLMRIVISLVQIAVIYGVTRPLLRSLGVARMNPVYPLTTLTSFGILITQFGLPAAIALHINGDAIYKAINLPVHQLNYNAIPRDIMGRIRTLSDGFIYAIGLTLAGVLLWLGETYLSLTQIAICLAGLTVALLAVRIPMGGFYATGLEEMIRSNSINLDEFDTYPVSLPLQSSDAIRELLVDPNAYVQVKGLELAQRTQEVDQFLPAVEALIPTADVAVYSGAIALFSNCTPDLLEQFKTRLDNPKLQAFALEVLLINRYEPEESKIQTWLDSDQADLQVLGAIAQRLREPTPHPTWSIPLNLTTARIITRVVAQSQSLHLMPLIPMAILTQENVEIVRAGLEALLPLAQPGDLAIATIAQNQLTHTDSMVRMAAYDLLRVSRCPEQLPLISAGLGDTDPRIRERAARTLASYGRAGLSQAKECLQSPQLEIVNTAITAIGQVRTRSASNILFEHLSPSYKKFAQVRKWQQQIPVNSPDWQPLTVAIADYQARLIQKVLFILSALGHARTVKQVQRLLARPNQTEFENAIEVLASLNHRRFVQPLMPLLESYVTDSPPPERPTPTPQWFRTKGYKILLAALESQDRWLRTGALIALSKVPSVHLDDPDPFVRQIAGQIFGGVDPVNSSPVHPSPVHPSPVHSSPVHFSINTAMNRLLLLKNVALFKNLSLDELLLIDKSLEQQQVMAEETIFTEGEWGSHLYIIASGQVQLLKNMDGTPQVFKQLQPNQHFGEVALFDDAPRWDSAIAIADSTLLKLEKNRFLSLVTQRPHIILEMCRFLSQRLRDTDKHRSLTQAVQTVQSGQE